MSKLTVFNPKSLLLTSLFTLTLSSCGGGDGVDLSGGIKDREKNEASSGNGSSTDGKGSIVNDKDNDGNGSTTSNSDPIGSNGESDSYGGSGESRHELTGNEIDHEVIECGVGYTPMNPDNTNQLIQTKSEFEKLYGNVMFQQERETPSVDFNHSTVIFITMGLKGSLGYAMSVNSIYLESVEQSNDFLKVNYTTTSPACNAASAQWMPYCLVKVNKLEGRPSFWKNSPKLR